MVEAQEQIERLKQERGDRCELGQRWWSVGLSICIGKVQGRHHLRKQSQGGGEQDENVLLSCNHCNGAVEDYPARAKELGLTISEGDPDWERLGKGNDE